MPAQPILLVEDDTVLRDLLQRNLVARGHTVWLAGDARSALAELQAAPVDLLILDINLPDQSGWEVLRIAQQQGWLRKESARGITTPPVVVLSAVRISLARIQEFHPLAYLPKPFPMDALLRLAAEAHLEASQSQSYEEGHRA